MSDPGSVTGAEQGWLAWLGQQHEQMMAYLSSWQLSRALSPEEVQGIVVTLDRHVQALNGVLPTADALSRQGEQSFAQRLTAEIRDLQGAQAVYHQMYDSAVTARAQQAQILRDADQFAVNTVLGAVRRRQAVFSRSVQGFIDVQEGNCFDCHQQIGVTGGGYCLQHARMRGIIV